MSDAHIILNHVSVAFPIYNTSNRSLKKRVLNAATGGKIASDSSKKVVIQSLTDINLNIQKGDKIGLIGHNGAGKSTLLRVFSGVYSPSSGSIDVQGKVVSLLDISVGLDGESTGFENIMLRGVLLGFSPKEIEQKINDIAEFSELGDFLNMPIRTYSSGMVMRLAFSIITSFPADIILMDEWLSVGDANFSQKAKKRLQDMVEKSSILIIASHDPDMINRLCNKVITLEHGSIQTIHEI
ncbi:ABC transporter ATP-binding protein [Acinetobacter sp. MD2(2019)]|uniref:ABC transporter ATP-binding protein n=1 Tax=Acinetobacter sp. MD2(2019) TaxID=2605273 RepID=UPI002D1F13F8|nr:ABC transporter ATP-binding protein [Acinetobacter sp. MD2(2019)]MEB3754430.1 ABC transporter ATP-binding protein [Acinetobacter sp. MD2(2019)]